MRFAGEALLHAPVEQVWQALLDPAVLVRTIPGCERLEETGQDRYDMTVTAGVAAVRGTYSGSCELRDLQPHESLVMAVQGAGGPGTISADVVVRFAERDDAGSPATLVSYDADAVVGGMLGGVGQRMLGSVSKRMAGEFFTAVDQALAGPLPTDPAVGGSEDGATDGTERTERTAPGVHLAPARPGSAGSAGSSSDFLRGAVVGAGLVLVGVAAGVLAGRAGSRRG